MKFTDYIKLSLVRLRAFSMILGTSILIAFSPHLSLRTQSQEAYANGSKTQQERLAVLTLQNRINMSLEETQYLTSLVRRIASKRLAHRYLVMTQENIEVLLPPDTKLEDCVSECQVETGRTLGARFIITGEVLRFGSSLRLTLRMHDTQSGQLLVSEVAKANDIEGLETPTEQLVETLVASIDERSSLHNETRPRDQQAIIVGRSEVEPSAHSPSFTSPRKSRQERLRERARLAQEERSARLEGRRERLQEQARKQAVHHSPKSNQTIVKENNTSDDSGHRSINSELYFGLGTGSCEINGVSCADQGLESDISLSLALRYYIDKNDHRQHWGWRSGLEIKYAHSSLSSSFSSNFMGSDLSYTVNHINVGYIFAFEAGWLNASANLGFGYSSGLYSIFDSRSAEQRPLDLNFQDVLNLNVGASVGIRLTPDWMLSVFTDRFRAMGESELCDQLSADCLQGELPEVTQTGLRLSFTM